MPEIILLITTLVVSLGDLLVNIFSICCSGRLKVEAPCIKVDHRENDKGFTKSEVDLMISETLERRRSAHF